MNVTSFTISTSSTIVTLSAGHKPNRQVYCPIAVYYTSKTYFGYVVSADNASGGVDFRAYYATSYGGSMVGCPTGASIYGSIPYYTA